MHWDLVATVAFTLFAMFGLAALFSAVNRRSDIGWAYADAIRSIAAGAIALVAYVLTNI